MAITKSVECTDKEYVLIGEGSGLIQNNSTSTLNFTFSDSQPETNTPNFFTLSRGERELLPDMGKIWGLSSGKTKCVAVFAN